MRKLILKQHQCPGDIIAMTAAVRDLKLAYPDYQIWPDTTCIDVWIGNPHITWMNPGDPGVEIFEINKDGICQDGKSGGHITWAFHLAIERALDIRFPQTSIFPDLHVSPFTPSIFERLADRDGSFWIINAGYKKDTPLKNWGADNYQSVIHMLRGRVQFVQVGDADPTHSHPKLDGVINLIGKTSLRDFIILCNQSIGSVGPISMHCHIMAAFQKPCVVIAGGREPYRYVAYPNQRHLHSNGLLECCKIDGCWKRWRHRDQVSLRDRIGDWENKICHTSVEGVPECMAIIKPAEVVGEILKYYNGNIFAEVFRAA